MRNNLPVKFMRFSLILVLVMMIPAISHAQKKARYLNGTTQGTTYSITYYDKNKRDLAKEIEAVFNHIDHVFSLWDSGSIISAINNSEQVEVTDTLFIECFNQSLEISNMTNGSFDITVGPIVQLWKQAQSGGKLPDSLQVDSLLTWVGFNKISLSEGECIKISPSVKIDMNGIAQGYTVDCVSELLISKGISDFIIEIGGEVLAHGQKPGNKSWIVGIETPSDNPEMQNPVILKVKLNDMSLATSGSYRKFYTRDGKRFSHIIDPRTGFPAESRVLSASVIAGSCAKADALATALMVMGLEKSRQFLESNPDFQAILIYTDFSGEIKIFRTSKIEVVE